jgi:hypothetical protein
VIIPFEVLSMTLQAVLFAWGFDGAFARAPLSVGRRGLYFAAVGAVLSWSFTTLAVAAKNVMSSVPDYVLIESAFTVVLGNRGPADGMGALEPPARRAACADRGVRNRLKGGWRWPW